MGSRFQYTTGMMYGAPYTYSANTIGHLKQILAGNLNVTFFLGLPVQCTVYSVHCTLAT